MNDAGAELVQATSSDENGKFSFENVAAGTYTAYFEAEGYADDFHVIPVEGGVVRDGHNVVLAPNIRTSSGFQVILTWARTRGIWILTCSRQR